MARLQQVRGNYNSSRVAASESGAWLQEPVLWKLVVITALAYLLWSDKICIVLGPVSDENTVSTSAAVRASFLDMTAAPNPSKRIKKTGVHIELPAGTLSNTTFAIDPAYAIRHRVKKEEVLTRQEKCVDYVERFAPIAMAEMRKFHIPASVILAQGLLESNAGDSPLARATNNHFGMKCFSNRCKKGHCANFSDDSHKDFFIKYGNAWSSFRAHSEFLKKTKRYQALFELPANDFRSWALGLEKSGYATDKQYAEKLIALIQALGLQKYDEPRV